MRILAVISGEYGARHVRNIRENGPVHWQVETWQSPAIFPLVIDYPEDYLPAQLPPADLILSFAEHKGVAELLPDLAQMTGAKAVMSPPEPGRVARPWSVFSTTRAACSPSPQKG